MYSINDLKTRKESEIPFLQMGFRPFFIGAASFAIISMLIWMLLLNNQFVGLFQWPAQIWHAHEMIYGYSLAVVAGFLLTSVKNWTGIKTTQQYSLLILFSFWLWARVMPFVSIEINVEVMAVLDLFFLTMLIYTLSKPIIIVKQWKQLSLIACLFLLLFGNSVFYAGMLGFLSQGVSWGISIGLYSVLGILLIMGRRVIPFFIEKGIEKSVGEKVLIVNRNWVDKTSLILFFGFAIVDIFTEFKYLLIALAGILSILHLIRAHDWYHQAILQISLVWILFAGYFFIALGFGIFSISQLLNFPVSIAVHAFAVGGVGMITLGMMARVSLGHTGRNVFSPPAVLKWVFGLVLLSAVVRTVFPLLNSTYYPAWVFSSQILWICAFLIFLWSFGPLLFKANKER